MDLNEPARAIGSRSGAPRTSGGEFLVLAASIPPSTRDAQPSVLVNRTSNIRDRCAMSAMKCHHHELLNLHLFERLASCLAHESPHKGQGERGGHGVERVRAGETERVHHWQEGDGHSEVHHPVGGAGHRQSPSKPKRKPPMAATELSAM